MAILDSAARFAAAPAMHPQRQRIEDRCSRLTMTVQPGEGVAEKRGVAILSHVAPFRALAAICDHGGTTIVDRSVVARK